MMSERSVCGLCGGCEVKLKDNRSRGTSRKGNKYDYLKSYFECFECGFEFVTFDLAQDNLARQREDSLLGVFAKIGG